MDISGKDYRMQKAAGGDMCLPYAENNKPKATKSERRGKGKK